MDAQPAIESAARQQPNLTVALWAGTALATTRACLKIRRLRALTIPCCLHNCTFIEGPKAALINSVDYEDGAFRAKGVKPVRGLRAFGRAYCVATLTLVSSTTSPSTPNPPSQISNSFNVRPRGGSNVGHPSCGSHDTCLSDAALARIAAGGLYGIGLLVAIAYF